MKKQLILIIALLSAGCTDQQKTYKTLSDNGYTDINVGGYSWFMCGNGDDYATEFTAKSPSGKFVSGAVCSGIFKGATIRFGD